MAYDEKIAAREMLEVIPLIMRTLRPDIHNPSGLPNPGHFHLLHALLDGPHSLSELAERHHVTLPTMSNTVTTLCEHGYVHRSKTEEDRRRVNIDLTPAGRDMLVKIRVNTESHITRILEPLSDEEKKQLIAGLLVLRKAFTGTHAQA